ncbi:hypothetical protein JRQ81_018720 [Phrynocephalus forsythii]|uniref:Uncharacterized protein n=1 Tax=Phrynocephalus forsythii TaxID=171643 RepID=A0A9Q0XP27_9SAUR|nr:hypothetical protein JRQ81_018720 [Phrynocephalus forsythii]
MKVQQKQLPGTTGLGGLSPVPPPEGVALLDSKRRSGRSSTRNLANVLLLLAAAKGERFVSGAAKTTAVKVTGAPPGQNLKSSCERHSLGKGLRRHEGFSWGKRVLV